MRPGRILHRLWPDTMAGQLIGLLLCGLLGAHLLAVLVSSKGDGGIHTLSRKQVVDDTVVAWRLVRQTDANAALAAFDSPTVRFRRTPAQPAMPPASSDAVAQREAAIIGEALRAQLKLAPQDVRIGWRSIHLDTPNPNWRWPCACPTAPGSRACSGPRSTASGGARCASRSRSAPCRCW